MSEEMKPQPQQINVEIGEKEAEGIFSNFVLIAHSPSEFIIDFARLLPGLPKAKVFARILMTPQHTMLLRNALEDNLKKFEERFGKIKLISKEDGGKGFGFIGGEKH
ncbi:MAG: DUF3467 domain-containing protein [Candidatus Latescibacteria bacterium]|nr:DUF3467 domain-containing protein [Candidatus Latescibacterota bacterium]